MDDMSFGSSGEASLSISETSGSLLISVNTPSISSISEREVSTACSTYASSAFTMSRMMPPSLPVPPTMATRVVMSPP